MERINPTQTIDIDFSAYVSKKKALSEAHMEGGVPDYAYRPDAVLRQKLKAIPGFYALAKAITNTYVPAMKQELNLRCLKVSASQFPDVYAHVTDCARTLGIGIPTVFIEPDPTSINAYTIAVEQNAPLVVVTSALLERFTPGELRTVLGHECGHIHNNHGVFDTAAKLILESLNVNIPVVQQILQAVSLPLRLALLTWNRAAEVTCDRAGVICSDNPGDMVTTLAKFMYGSTFTRSDVNIDEVLKQYEALRNTPVRLLELEQNHPSSIRRIFAIKELMNSETLLKWRPELRTPGMEPISKQELDARCEKFVSVFKSEKAR